MAAAPGLFAVRAFIQAQGQVSSAHLVQHFARPWPVLQPMLDYWIARGCVAALSNKSQSTICKTGCAACPMACGNAVVDAPIYLWVASDPNPDLEIVARMINT